MGAKFDVEAREGLCPIEERSPWVVAVLGVVTLGTYFVYWIWQTSKEAHAFDEYGASPYDVTKWAIPTFVVSGVGVLVTGVVFFSTVASQLPAQPASGGPTEFGPGFWAVWGIYTVCGLAMLVASIALVVALWRLWKFTERHERGLGRSSTLSPGLLLGALVVSYFLVLPLPLAAGYVLYRTQRGLNRIHRGARQGYEAKQAWGPGGRPPPRDTTSDGDSGGSTTTFSAELAD